MKILNLLKLKEEMRYEDINKFHIRFFQVMGTIIILLILFLSSVCLGFLYICGVYIERFSTEETILKTIIEKSNEIMPIGLSILIIWLIGSLLLVCLGQYLYNIWDKFEKKTKQIPEEYKLTSLANHSLHKQCRIFINYLRHSKATNFLINLIFIIAITTGGIFYFCFSLHKNIGLMVTGWFWHLLQKVMVR
jgi:uncharacterized membrane protein